MSAALFFRRGEISVCDRGLGKIKFLRKLLKQDDSSASQVRPTLNVKDLFQKIRDEEAANQAKSEQRDSFFQAIEEEKLEDVQKLLQKNHAARM